MRSPAVRRAPVVAGAQRTPAWSAARGFDGAITRPWIRIYHPQVCRGPRPRRRTGALGRRSGLQRPRSSACRSPSRTSTRSRGCRSPRRPRCSRGTIATGDCGVWRRLKAAGMVLLGHAHTDEFAFGRFGTPQTGKPVGHEPPALFPGCRERRVGERRSRRDSFPWPATGTETGGSTASARDGCAGRRRSSRRSARVSAYGVIPPGVVARPRGADGAAAQLTAHCC